MKNKLEMERISAMNNARDKSSMVKLSWLHWIKGIWEKTIATLLWNWIESMRDFKEISYDRAMTFLTPVQWHQLNLYIKENNI